MVDYLTFFFSGLHTENGNMHPHEASVLSLTSWPERIISFFGQMFVSPDQEPVGIAAHLLHQLNNSAEWTFSLVDCVLATGHAHLLYSFSWMHDVIQTLLLEMHSALLSISLEDSSATPLSIFVVLSAIMLLAVMIIYLCIRTCWRCVKQRKSEERLLTHDILCREFCWCDANMVLPWSAISLFVVGLFFFISVPWEFMRMYQHEVAIKAAVTLKVCTSRCDRMHRWNES